MNKKTAWMLSALAAVVVAGCATGPSVSELNDLARQVAKASFRDEGIVKAAILETADSTVRACSAADVAGKPLSKKQAKAIEDANLKTINDLIDRMGRITASLRSFARRGDDKGRASLGKAVDAALQVLGARVEKAALQVHRQFIDEQVQIDQTRLEQILVNLIGNALKYTPPGGTVTVTAAPVPGGVAFRVQDTGPGVMPEDQRRVFERFYRTDRSRSRPAGGGGSGVGLTIARGLARAMRGDVTVTSFPPDGSTFTLTLPADADATPPAIT